MEDVVWGFTVPDTSDEAYLHPQITLSLSLLSLVTVGQILNWLLTKMWSLCASSHGDLQLPLELHKCVG